MFATCLHCHSSLGTNELIEHFPIGRRLAFDASKGRLWVVCGKCRRWNLTPLEERWEAIEECERLYGKTPLRASTDNIGLARLADGLDVVRIGAPKTPEMAAWRYARDFGRRWIGNGIPLAFFAGGGMTALQQGLNVSQESTSLIFLMAMLGAASLAMFRKNSARIALASGRVVSLSRFAHRHVRLEAIPNGWGLSTGDRSDPAIIAGDRAVPALRAVMTAHNFAGGPKRDVAAAVAHLADARSPERFIVRLARASQTTGIHVYPPDIALALEMALHEDTERRALEGELTLLRDEWELAEEIAHIADNMLLPEAVLARFAQMRAGEDA